MIRRPVIALAPLAVGAFLVLPGCPLHVENEPVPNTPPNTFFERDPPFRVGGGDCGGLPAGEQQHSRWITFTSEVSFAWRGSDLDNDVVAYQYQLVETDSLYYLTGGLQGTVLRSLDPRSESGEEQWTDRLTETFQTFRDLSDGWFEFRVRAIDAGGAWDATYAVSRFEVFFDNVPPLPIIVNRVTECRRMGSQTQARFLITATDLSRKGTTPRSQLQYSVQLRATQQVNNCPFDFPSFTEWTCFPSDDPNDLVVIGTEPPSDYGNLQNNPGCVLTFTIRVRDPAGQITTDNTCQLVF